MPDPACDSLYGQPAHVSGGDKIQLGSFLLMRDASMTGVCLAEHATRPSCDARALGIPHEFVQRLQEHAAAHHVEVTLTYDEWYNTMRASLCTTMPHSLPAPLTVAPAPDKPTNTKAG